MHIADPTPATRRERHCRRAPDRLAPRSRQHLKTGQVAFRTGEKALAGLYEELNSPSSGKLPVIFVCENNVGNEYTHFSSHGGRRAGTRGLGMAHETIDGQNVRDVYTAASALIDRARRGEGPAFLQCITYRYHGHHVGDIARAYYRPKTEEQEWVTERDPITLHGEWLMANGVADRAALDAIQAELITEMDAAVEFAINSPYPDPKVTQDHAGDSDQRAS
jgi:pyruvate dehydrogenase E1 component alpha subunit